MFIRAASHNEPVPRDLAGQAEAKPPGQLDGLKYFRIQFTYAGATKYLRLTGWSEAAALAEFRRYFPEQQPELIEFLGIV